MFERIVLHLRLLWALLFLLSVSLAAETHPLCPQSCRCDAELLEVNCSLSQLSTVPSDLSRDAIILNLTHNKIKTLLHQQFQSLRQLLHLDLNDNLLEVVELDAFLGLESLLTLRLARNRLKIIPVGAFAGLLSLQFLDISSNDILVFLDFTLRDLPALQHLNAADNQLVFVSGHAFTGLNSLQELHLDACNLTAVPTESFSQLTTLRSLHFHCLSLTSLPNYAFHYLVHLKELIISHCPWLDALSGNSLLSLNLTSLTITHGNLSVMPYLPLHHLVYLISLDLSFNPITSIQGNLLGDLLRLQELHLVGGSLLRIETRAFRGLVNFRLLNVSRNRLTTLESGAFQSLMPLKTLILDNNPLACDCRLLWMVQRRVYLDFGRNLPTCSSSLHLEDWSFLEFSDTELSGLLTCQQPQILNCKPQRVKVNQGQTVVFDCIAEGDPTPSLSWFNPQLRPVSSTGRIWVLTNGSLEVRYAQPQDSGTYYCLASNAAGNDSLKVSLQVRPFLTSRKSTFHLGGWIPSSSPDVSGNHELTFDFKTLLIAASIGFLSFFSSVSVCFIFMFLWSKSKGHIKHTATIKYVPHSTVSTSARGNGNYMETSRFTMKLL